LKQILYLSLFIFLFVGSSAQAEEKPKELGEQILEDCAHVVPAPEEAEQAGNPSAAFAPGKGFLVGRNKCGSMSISAYMLMRYINQTNDGQIFTTHTGEQRKIDGRNDIQMQRAMVHFRGFLFDPKFKYNFTVWTVTSTEQVALIGNMTYSFNDHFNFGGGVAGNAGTRSLNAQHPYFLGTDRHMIDEFMRPGFTHGIWSNGKVVDKLNYRAMIGNNLSQLGVNSKQLSRDLAYSGTIWWLPTTGEFGPREGFGDYEYHAKLATRFGVSATKSREDRFSQPSLDAPDNTQIRISDSTLFFEKGAFGPDVTVNRADYNLYAFDAALKYHGMFFMAEYYHRRVDNFSADGNPNTGNMVDTGLGLQGSFFINPKKWETYLAASQLWGEYNDSHEIAIGNNYYPYDSRNFRINAVVIFVDQSAAESAFGYYVGGQSGTTFVAATDIFF